MGFGILAAKAFKQGGFRGFGLGGVDDDQLRGVGFGAVECLAQAGANGTEVQRRHAGRPLGGDLRIELAVAADK